MRSRLTALLLIGGVLLTGAAEKTLDEAFAGRVLDEVWQEVARNHFERDFDARYRKSVYERFRPRILASPDEAALIANLNRMLDAVGTSHLRVFGPGRDTRLKKLRPVEKPGDVTYPVDPGFTLLSAPGRILVRNVRPGSAAEAANVRPGDEVLALDGLELQNTQEQDIERGQMANYLLTRGGRDSICTVKLRSADGRTREIRLPRTADGGKFFTVINLPRLPLRYEAKLLAPGTGYVRFNIFVPEVIRKFRRDLRRGALKGIDRLILDLRGNPGGVLLTAEWLGAWCVPKRVELGKLVIDGVELAPVSEPQEGGFTGKLTVLVDGETMSTGELFAAAIQDAGAGKIVGAKTPGKCLPSMFITLPCRYRLQTVAGNIIRPSGKSLERLGVTPDVTVANGFRDGRDLVIEKALAVLKEK